MNTTSVTSNQRKSRQAFRELSVSDYYSDEEMNSSHIYPSKYRVKDITEQTDILWKLFPSIGCANENIADQPLPNNAEGWFAIPRWDKIANTYSEAVAKVFAKINSQRNSKSGDSFELGYHNLRQSKHTSACFQQIHKEQKNHILVVPAQFGIRHRGRSVRRSCEVMPAGEFGLGLFAVGIMLLTHPKRLVSFDDLWIACAGDESVPYEGRDFSHTPVLCYSDGEIKLCEYWCGATHPFYGSASGFLQK